MKTYLVVGLARFGTAVARKLRELGNEVMVLDNDEEKVSQISDSVEQAQIGDGTDSSGWIEELSFRDAISALSEREKRILYLRFFRGKTQVEVAEEIGISQAQVSRLEKNTIDKVRGVEK